MNLALFNGEIDARDDLLIVDGNVEAANGEEGEDRRVGE